MWLAVELFVKLEQSDIFFWKKSFIHNYVLKKYKLSITDTNFSLVCADEHLIVGQDEGKVRKDMYNFPEWNV